MEGHCEAEVQCSVVVRYINQALGIIRKDIDDKTANVALPWQKFMISVHLCGSGPLMSKRIYNILVKVSNRSNKDKQR